MGLICKIADYVYISLYPETRCVLWDVGVVVKAHRRGDGARMTFLQGGPNLKLRHWESQCSYSKFLSQQWQLTNNSKNCIAFYGRTTWHMDLRQLTVYKHFRWVNMRAITFLIVGQSSSRVWLWGYPHCRSGGLIRWILGQILNFHDQKFYFSLGGGLIPILVCTNKTWSISSAYENLRGQHPLRAEM